MSIYAQRETLARNLLPVLVGCTAGAVASVGSIWVLCRLFGLDKSLTVSLLPKSVTTPIATAIAEGHGGMVPITVAAVILTGILGNLMRAAAHPADGEPAILWKKAWPPVRAATRWAQPRPWNWARRKVP